MMNQNLFLIIVLIGIIALTLLYLNEENEIYRFSKVIEDEKNKQNKIITSKCNTCNNKEDIQQTEVLPTNTQQIVVHQPHVPQRDVVADYDYRKVISPLEQPVRRVPRHWIPPAHIKRMIDIPSRGYPDTFHQLGVLTRDGESDDKDNKILRLMGRETYPGSGRYEYYTRITSGNETINIPIEDKKNRELYDDDIINLPELGNDYKTKIFRYDSPKYYPDLF